MSDPMDVAPYTATGAMIVAVCFMIYLISKTGYVSIEVAKYFIYAGAFIAMIIIGIGFILTTPWHCLRREKA